MIYGQTSKPRYTDIRKHKHTERRIKKDAAIKNTYKKAPAQPETRNMLKKIFKFKGIKLFKPNKSHCNGKERKDEVIMKTVAQESRMLFNSIKFDIKRGNEEAYPYLGGTVNKKTRMYKEVAKYEEYAKIDYDLGIITSKQYEIEIKAVKIFEKALANYNVH